METAQGKVQYIVKHMGREFRFMGKPGATPEQLANAVKMTIQNEQAQEKPTDRAETPEERAARYQQLSRKIKSEKGEPYKRLAEETGGFQSFGVGVAEGAMNMARGLGMMDQAEGPQKEAYQALSEEHPYATGIGEAAGEAAPGMLVGGGITSIPKLGASLAKSVIKRAALTGGISAAESAIAARGKGATGYEQVGAGTIGGATAAAAEMALPKLLRLGGKVFRSVTGKTAKGALIDAAGKPTQELAQALAEDGRKFADLAPEEVELLKKYTGKNAMEAERAAFLESMGFTGKDAPTKAQIQRTAKAFLDQQEAAKDSVAIRGRLQNHNALLINKFDEPIENMAINPKTTGHSLYDAVLNKATELDNNIHDMYKIAEKQTGGDAVVIPDHIAATLNRLKPQNKLSGGLVEAIEGEMKALGYLDKEGNILNPMTVEEAENLVQSVNSMFKKGDKNHVRISRIIKDAIDDSVTKAGGEELYKAARLEKAAYHRQLQRTRANKFDERTTSLIEDILTQKANPKELADEIFKKGYRGTELNDLKNFLHSGTESQKAMGEAAWKDFKAETVERIKNAALTGAKDERGNLTLSRDKFQKAIGKIGDDKMKVLFDEKELKFFKDMEKALELVEPISGTLKGYGPSSYGMGKAANKIIDKIANFTKTAQVMKAFKDIKIERGVLKAKPADVFIPEPVVKSTARNLALGAGAYTADKEYNEKR